MNRMKTYDVPHKALRNALSQLSMAAGKCNYDQHAEVETLHILATEVFTLLSIHSEDENSVTLAELEKRLPGASNKEMAEHEQLHILQFALEQQINRIFLGSQSGDDILDDGAEFYLAFSEFHGTYLLHIAEEERNTQPLLWAHFSDEELAGQRQAIMGKMAPETLLTWMKFIIPSQNHQERLGLLTGFKQVAPTPIFEQTMNIIRLSVSPSEYDQLQIELDTI
jgi:hypothetical protein